MNTEYDNITPIREFSEIKSFQSERFSKESFLT